MAPRPMAAASAVIMGAGLLWWVLVADFVSVTVVFSDLVLVVVSAAPAMARRAERRTALKSMLARLFGESRISEERVRECERSSERM